MVDSFLPVVSFSIVDTIFRTTDNGSSPGYRRRPIVSAFDVTSTDHNEYLYDGQFHPMTICVRVTLLPISVGNILSEVFRS